MARNTGTDIHGARVKGALAAGYPLTVREVARFADCSPATAKAHLERLEHNSEAVRWREPNEVYELWVAVTSSAVENWATILLIAERNHRATNCPEAEIVRGANFIECLGCGKHAHIYPGNLTKPLIVHTGKTGRVFVAYIRPQEF